MAKHTKLKTLLEGYKPGGSVLPEEDQDI